MSALSKSSTYSPVITFSAYRIMRPLAFPVNDRPRWLMDQSVSQSVSLHVTSIPPTSVLYGRHCTGYYYVTANILVTLRCVGHVPSTSISHTWSKAPEEKPPPQSVVFAHYMRGFLSRRCFFPGGSKRGGFMVRWGLRLFPTVDENLEKKNARL